jgi:hypothetical protein
METFYIVRNANTDVICVPRNWSPTKSNAFPSLEIAVTKARQWAALYPNSEYLVYEVHVIGRAAVSHPPVTYTDYRTGEQE